MKNKMGENNFDKDLPGSYMLNASTRERKDEENENYKI